MNFIKLQPLTPPLLESAHALDRQVLGGLWSLDAYRREIESPNSDLFILQPELQPEEENSPVVGLGCVWAILEEAHITLLAVDPSYQGQGMGQALLYGLLRSAHQRGLEWATLEVRVSNQPALSLYRKFGFEAVGQRRKYYQDTGEDALILWRRGLQHPDFGQTLHQWHQHISDRLFWAGWRWSIASVARIGGDPYPDPAVYE